MPKPQSPAEKLARYLLDRQWEVVRDLADRHDRRMAVLNDPDMSELERACRLLAIAAEGGLGDGEAPE